MNARVCITMRSWSVSRAKTKRIGVDGLPHALVVYQLYSNLISKSMHCVPKYMFLGPKDR